MEPVSIIKMVRIALITMSILVAIFGISNIHSGISKKNKEIRGNGLIQLVVSAIMISFSFAFPLIIDTLTY